MEKKRTNKRKRAKAARRLKIMITSIMVVVLVLAVILLVFLLGGFGNAYESGTNTIYLLEDGRLVSNSVEIFDENAYSKDDLKAYIKETVDTYNAENEKAVKQKSLTVKDGKAVLVLEYASAEDYEKFEGTEIFVGTLKEALKAGYTFEGDFVNVSDGKMIPGTSEEFIDNSDYQVMIVKANVNVRLEERQIYYVSSQNTESVKDGVVVIKDAANLLANVDLDDTEDTEIATEIEGVITDEELLLESEEEIIFDFGDEEVEENPYSSVYTYIIYK